MSKDGNINDNSTISSGRKKENRNKYREEFAKIDWTKHKTKEEDRKWKYSG